MKKYRYDEGNDSEFEDDEECFKPLKVKGQTIILGNGSFDRARVFASPQGNEVVSLQPVKNPKASPSLYQARRKFDFFKALYPGQTVELFTWNNNSDYRLVVPKLPGVEFHSNIIHNSIVTRLDTGIALLRAIQDVHLRGFVIVDLSESNILYDEGTFYVIDGGLSARIDNQINPNVFVLKTSQDITKATKEFFHIAPECWSTSSVLAHPSMDVFSLGRMLRKLFGNIRSDHLTKMLSQCRDLPSQRPSICSMIATLEEIKNEYQKKENNEGIISKMIKSLTWSFWSSDKKDTKFQNPEKPGHDSFGVSSNK